MQNIVFPPPEMISSITLYDTMFLVFSIVQNGSASLRKAKTVMGDSIITVELKHTPIQQRNR